MTSYQMSILNFLYVSVDSHLFYPKKKVFLRNYIGNKAIKLFCIIPAIAPCAFFKFYITVQFLIVNLFGKAM